MKRQSLFLIASLAPAFALAAPTVTFLGAVSDQTCEITINNQTDSTVLLPTVPATKLQDSGETAGLTPFTVQITNCQQPNSPLTLYVSFLGHSVTTKGNLGNLAINNSATNVQLQLTGDASGTTSVVLNGKTPVPGPVLDASATSTNYQFGVRYISEQGGATAGSVSAVAEYALEYQ